MNLTVAKWLGLTEEEYKARAGNGACLKCGDEARPPSPLCRGCRTEFTEWAIQEGMKS